MPSLNRTVTGLLLREDFSALNGWTAGTGFSNVGDPSLVTWGRLPTVLLAPRASGQPDYDGVREGQLYVEGSTWYLLYDAGDNTTGWKQFIGTSTDRGLTWSRAVQSIGYDNGSSGTYPAVCTGWLEKRGSTYYLQRITAASTFASPNVGLPLNPYEGDTWTASSITGTWTFVRAFGPGTGWADTNLLPGSVYYDGSTYTMGIEGSTAGAVWHCGLQTSSSPSGPWTLNATAQFDASMFSSRMPENPKVFYHSGLAKFFTLLNLIEPGGNFTDRNAVAFSSSVSDWSSSIKYVMQRYLAPCDTNGNAVGVACHATGPDGALISEGGYVPMTWDADPRASSPGWHRGRSILGGVLEPAKSRLGYSDGTASRFRYYKSLSHTDFVAEFEADVSALATGSDISFEYRTNGTTGYRLVIRADAAAPRLLLQTMAGTSIQSNTTGTAIVEVGVMHRIKVSCVGTQHDAWIDGEHQINVTDATYSSGTQVALSAKQVTGSVRLLHIRSSDVLTIRGLIPSTPIYVRSHGQLPVSQITPNGSGVATYTGGHFPISRVEYTAGIDVQTPDFLLWGGDDVTYDAAGHRGASGGGGGTPVFGGA